MSMPVNLYELVRDAALAGFFESDAGRLVSVRPYLSEPYRLALNVIDACGTAEHPEVIATITGLCVQSVNVLLAALRDGGVGRLTEVHPKPTFILGNQKSGTSVIAALLAIATGRSVTLDLYNEILRPSFPGVIAGFHPFQRFLRDNKISFTRDIIKEPNLTLMYTELARHFPKSSYVFVLRDPRDNIRSILDRLAIPGNLPCLSSLYLRSVSPAWALTLDGTWLGLNSDNYVETLAMRWNYFVDVFLANRQSMVLVSYEQFVADKKAAITRLATRLEYPIVSDITSRLSQQFQPRGANRDRPWHDFFGPANLALIERICKSRMDAVGYQKS